MSKRALPVLVALVVLLASCSFELNYDKYAIVYGISDYAGTANDLQYSDDDAIAVSALLEQEGYEAAPYTRIDGAATKANLVADLNTLAARAGEDDLLVIFYSGHGGQGPANPAIGTETAAGADAYEEWIFLYDSIDSGGNVDLSQTVNDDQLASLLRSVPCLKKIVILDACNSGGFIGNRLESDGTPTPYQGTNQGILETFAEAIQLYTNFDGSGSDISPSDALVITAAGERELSWEGLYNHGVFTYFLLQSADRGDRNRDGYVTVFEAYDYAGRMIDSQWNFAVYGYVYGMFVPRASGGPVDYVLFGSGR